MAPYPKALVFEIYPDGLSVGYPGTNENLTAGLFYSDVSYTLLFVAVGLWGTYLIFCNYYGRKYGEF